jgi:hypothetical protein
MEAAQGAIFLLARHRQEIRIFRLLRCQRDGVAKGRAQRILIDTVGGNAGGAAIGGGSDRNNQTMFSDVLVNGVVRETSQGFDGLIDLHFGFWNVLRLGQAKNGGGDGVEIALGTQHGVCSRGTFGVGSAHWSEKAVPIFTFRKRAGAAPWPVPITCMG